MGTLRVILALSVLVGHSGQSLAGIRFYGGSGIMAVETFYMLSGFYMALVLSTRYRERTADFYYNRFLRLFPTYWLLLGLLGLGLTIYWLVLGNQFGAIASLREGFQHPGLMLCSGLADLAIVGSDWVSLVAAVSDKYVGLSIAIPPVWTVAVEISFYLVVPFVIRLSIGRQALLWLAALAVHLGIWFAAGQRWSEWQFHFPPAAFVFFFSGTFSYHAYAWLKERAWFQRAAAPIGYAAGLLLIVWIGGYEQSQLLEFRDWRYYAVVFVTLPFLFAATKDHRADAAIGETSYPLYLSHWVVMSLWAPLRHFVAREHYVYSLIVITALLSYAVVLLDRRLQARFKHKVAAT